MKQEILSERYKIYIPTKMMDSLKDTAIYKIVVENGATIFLGTGIWKEEEESVSVHEIFGDYALKISLEMLAEVMLRLGEEAVLIDVNGKAILYTLEEKKRLL